MPALAPHADRKLFFCLGILVVLGLVSLTSASAPFGYAKFGDAYFFIKRQLLFGFLPGVIAFIVLAKIDYRLFVKTSWIWYAISLVLLVLVFIPGVGVTINHSHSWLTVLGIQFQPVELAKMAIILVSAYILTSRTLNWDQWQTGILPVIGLVVPALALIALQPDAGTLSILVVSVGAMWYVGRMPSKYLLLLGCLGVMVFSALIISTPYRLKRLTTFLRPELDPQGVGYQINQAFLAVGSGGWWGLGLGQSRQKFQYLPEVNADSIFAVMAEEGGFLLSTTFVILVLFIGWRGFRIAGQVPDPAGKIIVAGVITWFLWQSFLNIGAMVGALPLTGVPLPLVSHGGTAMLTMLAAFGMVLNISKTRLIAPRF